MRVVAQDNVVQDRELEMMGEEERRCRVWWVREQGVEVVDELIEVSAVKLVLLVLLMSFAFLWSIVHLRSFLFDSSIYCYVLRSA